MVTFHPELQQSIEIFVFNLLSSSFILTHHLYQQNAYILHLIH